MTNRSSQYVFVDRYAWCITAIPHPDRTGDDGIGCKIPDSVKSVTIIPAKAETFTGTMF